MTGNRALFFTVSSEIFSKHSVSFIFLVGNIALIFFIQFVTSYLRANNYIRKLVGSQKWEMVYGQVINVMAPLTLPWTFVMLEAGVRNLKTKLSVACNILIFFMVLVFPIYYFF